MDVHAEYRINDYTLVSKTFGATGERVMMEKWFTKINAYPVIQLY